MRPVGRPILALMAFLVGALGFAASSYSHALQPGYLALRSIDKGIYAVTWKTPAIGARPMAIAARLPESCDPRTPGQPTGDCRSVTGGAIRQRSYRSSRAGSLPTTRGLVMHNT